MTSAKRTARSSKSHAPWDSICAGVAPAEKFPELGTSRNGSRGATQGNAIICTNARRQSPSHACWVRERHCLRAQLQHFVSLLHRGAEEIGIARRTCGWIDALCLNDDYHDVLGEKLDALTGVRCHKRIPGAI